MLALASAAAAPACKGRGKSGAGATAGSDAGPASDAATAADAATPRADLSFIRGAIYAAAEHDHHITAQRLDPATGAWVPIGGTTDLFPTSFMLRGGVLVIATEGATAADHVEQLAIVRGTAIEHFGPRAGAVRNPTVAADGTVVVETSEQGFRDLYRVDAAGASSRLTDNREGNFEPSLAPSGKDVVFSSSRDGDSEIYRAPVAGGPATRLTAFHKDDWSPQWSPAGAHIVFLSDREGPPRLFLMSPDGTAQRRATPETDLDVSEDLPRWSPDGSALLFTRGSGIHQRLSLLDLASSRVRILTPEGFADFDAAWSPDGQYLAVLRTDVRVTRAIAAGSVLLIRATDGAQLADLGPSSGIRFVRWLP